MLIIRRLIWLLKHPVPVPWGWVALAVAALMVWCIGEVSGAAFDLTAKIAVLTGCVAAQAARLRDRIARLRVGMPGVAVRRMVAVLLSVAAAALVLLLVKATTLLQVQMVVTWVYLGVFCIVLMRLAALKRYPETNVTLGAASVPIGILAAQSNAIMMLSLAVLNMLAIRHLTPEVWLISFALLPLILYPLRFWTMIAMWPNDRPDG